MIFMLTLNTANVWGQTADTITVDSPGTVINTNTALELEVKHNPVKLRGFKKGDGIPADIMALINADPALRALYDQVVYLWKQDDKIAAGKTTAIVRASEEWSTNLEKLRRQLEEVRTELQNTKADLENQKKSANLAPPPAPANSANDSMLVLRMILDGQLVPKVALDDQAERMAKLPGTKIEVNPNFENIGIGNASDSARVEMSIGSNNGNGNGLGIANGDSSTVTTIIGSTVGVKDTSKQAEEAKTETVVESRLRKPAGMAFSLRGGKYGILQPEICPVCGTLDLNADTAFFAGAQLNFWIPIANVFGIRGDVSGDYLTGAKAITASGAAFFTLEPQIGNGFSPQTFRFTPIIGFGVRANYFDAFQADARMLAGFEAGTQKFGIFATAEKAVVDVSNTSFISFKTAPERMAAGFYAGPVKLGFMQETKSFGDEAFFQQKGVTLGVRF